MILLTPIRIASLALGAVLLVPFAGAQSISSIKPRIVQAGSSTTLTISGKGLDGPLQVRSTVDAAFHVESVEPEKAVIVLTLPEQAAPGPMGIWFATKKGPTEPVVMIVDDLNAVDESGDNHSIDHAQLISPPVVVEGLSNGVVSDFYRFQVEKGQRIAVEVLTQVMASTMDPVVRLLDAQGNQLHLADDDEIGPEPRFSYAFEQPGEYWIEVRDNRYSAGGSYHLRVGDFPHVAHCFPMAIQRGASSSIGFESLDSSVPLPTEITIDESSTADTVCVATRLDGGQSSSRARLHISDLPLHVESQSQQDLEEGGEPEESIILPIAISGRLSQPTEQDVYRIQGVKDKTFRFRARTRSLGSRALLQMQLFKADGSKVAQTDVSNVDEWSFDYTFADDAEYRLVVCDLLERGGIGFGYLVEVSSGGTFSIAWKPDSKNREQFAIEQGLGACVTDLQISRFGYDGEIALSLDPADAGLKILNPLIAAGAKEARLFLVADETWQADSAAIVRIVAEAKETPGIRSVMTSLALHRAKRPHVPFPDDWNDGFAFFGGKEPGENVFTIEPETPLQFARSLSVHTGKLNLKRTNDKFKSGVELLADPAQDGWNITVKPEGDLFNVTWTRNNTSIEPSGVSLVTYSEFEGSGRAAPVEFPVQWIDPLRIRLELQSPLIAGRSNSLNLVVDREGSDSQPAELKWTKRPASWTVPEVVSIAADAEKINLELVIPASYGEASGTIGYEVSSKYQGNDFTITGEFLIEPIISAPAELVVYPSEIMLDGSSSQRQLVVTGYDLSGTPRDWTHDALIHSAQPDIAEVVGGIVQARTDGDTEIVVQAGDKRLVIPVQVRNTESENRTLFESDVLVALSKQGCNSGACHGSPSGKGMFRLSLRAFDRQLDELTLIREDFGRRINRIEPEESLLLLKPLMKVSHGGGKKLHETDPAYAILHDWIAQGAKPDTPETPRCVQLEVYPNEKRVMSLDGGSQQLSVVAHFADGRSKDVTQLAVYESSDSSVADVDEQGLVTPAGRGEAVILVRFLEHIESVPLMFIRNDPDFRWAADPANNYIDEHVYEKLQQLQVLPSPLCSDAEFLRRVYLDVVGILPNIEESKKFLADTRDDKRSRLIDELLERDEFAKFWALKWGDLLKMTGKIVGDDGVHKYHRWVEESFRTNMSYDLFVRELLSAKGSTLANPPANFFRTSSDMNECVETVSQVFMGARLQCAKCHNHPFERWTQDNYYGLGAFFNRLERRNTQRPGEMFIWTAESGEVTNPRTGQQMKPWLPGFGELDPASLKDRRDALVDWLVKPDNPFLARIEANRIWSQCFSRGIVNPIDDFRDSNPPSNSSLLDALAGDFTRSGFDRKHLIRTILNSRTYQASCEANDSNRDDVKYFSHQRPRMLGAEQLLDAVNHVTGLEQKLGNLPAQTKATQLPAPDLVTVDFLKVFGQPERSTVCACERSDSSNLGMAIELFNGATIHEKLGNANNRFRQAVAAGQSLENVVTDLYFAALCRPPSDEESQAAIEHCRRRDQVADGLEDVCWALLNTDEFLFQH